MVFCQEEAIELLVFYENLLENGNTETIIQATQNNLKEKYKYRTTGKALQSLYTVLNEMLSMKLTSLMAALIDSHPTKVMWNNDVLPDTLYSDIGMSQWNHTLLDKVAGVSNHPVSVYDKP